ncbi:MAG: ABC transporter ATP-binding protein/permease [Treponema sp.]|nr:ABC transporter ATP-binding protein/permease [Treponema sp.]
MLKWIWSYIRKYAVWMFIGISLTIFVSALNMINPSITGMIVDRVITGGNHSLLPKLILIMIGCTFGKAVIRYLYQTIYEQVSQNVMRKMREDLYAHIQTLDFSWYDKSPTGNVMTMLTSDLDMVRHFVAWVIYMTIDNVLVYVFSIVVLSRISWKLTLAFLVIAPVILFMVWKFKDQIKPSHLKVRDQFARLNTKAGENIAGNRVVKAFVREEYEMELFEKENMGYHDCNIENADIRIRYTPAIEAICGILPVILILFGGYLVVKGEITLGNVVTFNGLMWTFSQPVNMFAHLMDNYQRFNASAQRLYELYGTKGSIKDSSKANPFLEEKKIEMNDGVTYGNISFKNVSFAYNETKVLKNLNFEVKPGMTVGILGPTGSGKSTIARLLCRYYDVTEGEILIDGKNIREYDVESLRKHIGITMQEAFLFSDTVAGNIKFGNTDATFPEVEKATELARVKDFLNDLSEGYDTIVGERGVGLSGGQRQRIALARLFLANPPVMILDDTTSAVDIETEEKIRASIKEMSEGHTTFIISHRVSSFENCDLILVVENGEITARGTHDELKNQPGYYKDVWELQK